MSVDAALTWVAGLPLWDERGGWRETVRDVLRCVGRHLCHEHSPAWLPFCCAEATGGASEPALAVAAAWSLLYVAAHLLDEVQDQEFEPQDWGGLNPAQGINVASAFLVAIPAVLQQGDSHLVAQQRADFERAALQMAVGQHADLAGWIGNSEDVVDRYWQVVTAKSGVLFALACRAGARLGNPPDHILDAFADFGNTLGCLIQVCDDYRDTYGASDLRSEQDSLPLVYGQMVAGSRDRRRIKDLLSRSTTDAWATAQLCQLLDDLGARHYLLLQIELLQQQAEAALQQARVTGPNLERLLQFLPGNPKYSKDLAN